MLVGNISAGRTVLPLVVAVVLAVSTAPAESAEVLLEGFEKAGKYRTTGKVAVVKADDAVTQGASALQLQPGSKVTIRIPAGAASRIGWLKIDTFEVRPVMASLRLTVVGAHSRTGFVRPGKDTLSLPLGFAGRRAIGAWPKQPVTLELHNAGSEAVVIDNVRLADPPLPPDEAILLDFGPANQALWPGFEPGESVRDIAWSGNRKIQSYAIRYPDPLRADFTGPRLDYRKQTDVLTLEIGKKPSVAWAWLTHYGTNYSTMMEYAVKINRRNLLRRRLSPDQMLSTGGLLRGKNESWTTEWFQRTFVKGIVSTLEEFPLKAGKNRLELTNCQVAAMIIAPRRRQNAVRDYVREMDKDLRRYHRQFVLTERRRPRCKITPTEQEVKAGMIVILPPRDEWFNRLYEPEAKHRIAAPKAADTATSPSKDRSGLKLIVAAGSSATAALVVMPCKDGSQLKARIDSLRGPGGLVLPASACRIYALETMPVVRDARVYYQPFLPVRQFRSVRAWEPCWFVLRVTVPEKVRAGVYKGSMQLSLARQASAQVPVEVEIARIRPDRTGAENRTFGVLSRGDCFDVYYSLANNMPSQRRAKISKGILSQLFDSGLNAAIVQGPTLTHGLDLVPSSMVQGLRAYPRPQHSGKTLVSHTNVPYMLGHHGVQTDSARYTNVIRSAVRTAADLAGKGNLGDFALYCGHTGKREALAVLAVRAEAVRYVKGKPALSTYASFLNSMEAARRKKLLTALDTLICSPNHTKTGAIAEQFKKTGAGAGKTFALRLDLADVYAAGFYCWAVGADGAYAGRIFYYLPLFNAFVFNPQSLLLPGAGRSKFTPTLSLLKFKQGIDDYDLARRCQSLAKAAARRSVDTAALENILSEIRVTANAKLPVYKTDVLRSTSVPPEKLQKWRTDLIREAAKVSEKLAK